MLWDFKRTKRSMSALRNSVAHFAREESGSMTFLGIYMVMIMMIVGGLGVDMMRNEMERTRVQATLDRAVLAAGDRDQKLDPTSVVEDYFEKAGMADYLVYARPGRGLNYTSMIATASTDTPAPTMRLLGQPTLPVIVQGEAAERVENVEISMILDISGSMKNPSATPGKTKLESLQDAAKLFVDTVLIPDNTNTVSISLVPYSEHVNIGQNLYNQLTTFDKHNYSYCVEMPNSQYGSAALNLSLTYEQVQHFQWNPGPSGTYWRYLVEDTVCPQYTFESIRPVTQNASALRTQIDNLVPRAGTSIFLGMKWGTALLDPSTTSIVNTTLTGADTVFNGRPAAYSDPETLKTVILMTDGKNDRSYRIYNSYYNSNSEIAHWANNNFRYYENYIWPSYYGSLDYQKYTASQGDGFLSQICTAAKNAGIEVWTIGFEVDDHGAGEMAACASSPSHFFDVEGIEISYAFRSIARQINELRLTQ